MTFLFSGISAYGALALHSAEEAGQKAVRPRQAFGFRGLRRRRLVAHLRLTDRLEVDAVIRQTLNG
jgi:hypothetical protein